MSSLCSYLILSSLAIQVLLPGVSSVNNGPAAAGAAGSRQGLLLPEHLKGLGAHSLLAAQVQPQVASNGPAGRPHSRADHSTSSSGICRSSWSSCGGEEFIFFSLITFYSVYIIVHTWCLLDCAHVFLTVAVGGCCF